MIAEDKERELERSLSFLEYHASFTNYEGVKKAKEFRKDKSNDKEKEDEEFLNSVKTNEFKNNPLIEAIKRLRESSESELEKESAFSSINLNKLIKEDI